MSEVCHRAHQSETYAGYGKLSEEEHIDLTEEV